jgi:arsenate reductase
MIKVYHNPGCSKSNACLAFLDGTEKPYQIINYLDETPSEEELRSIIQKLGVSPIDIVRRNEPLWIELFEGKAMTDDEVIHAMTQHPILIERPIVVNGDKAVIARPTGAAAKIL